MLGLQSFGEASFGEIATNYFVPTTNAGFGLTGETVGWKRGYGIVPVPGMFGLTGISIAVGFRVHFPALGGVFAFNGQNVSFRPNFFSAYEEAIYMMVPPGLEPYLSVPPEIQTIVVEP